MRITRAELRDPAHWILGFSVATIAFNGYAFRGHELDDGLIYARYIQNLISFGFPDSKLYRYLPQHGD